MGYRGKVVEREQARALRAEGRTLAEIAAALDVAKSSVSGWVRDVEFTPRPAPGRRGARRRGPNRLEQRKQTEIERLRQEGVERIGTLSEREFLVAGVALYAGEGSKRDGAVEFTNTDPQLVAFFCTWLRQFFDIDESRMRVRLYLHIDRDAVKSTAHWAGVTGVPPTQFSKAYRARNRAAVRTAKHVHGCARVSYACSRTHRAIMGLVHGLMASSFGAGEGATTLVVPSRSSPSIPG